VIIRKNKPNTNTTQRTSRERERERVSTIKNTSIPELLDLVQVDLAGRHGVVVVVVVLLHGGSW
jgi:hypothetical protein